MNFEDAWAQYAEEIKRLSLTQRVPGMDPDDVMSEMSICLWRATQTYRRGTTSFGAYWWSLWLNRRSDIASAYYAIKRIHPILTDELPEVAYEQPLFPIPPTTDPLGVRVWGSLAQGDTAQEVQRDEGLSRRRYYATLDRLRTDDVRESLRPE